MSYLLEDMEKWAALENYYDETGNAGGEFGWKVRGTETKKEQEKRLKAEAAHDAWVKKHQASKKYHALSAGLVASGLYKGHRKQNLASLGLLSGGLAAGVAAGIGNRNAYNKYRRAQAEQEKTAAPKVGLDGFYDIEDTEFKKKYNSHSEAPVGRIYHNPNLSKIQMRHKKDDPSSFEIFLKDQEKVAEDRDREADLRYLNQLYEETQAAQRKYHQGLKRAKRMGGIGLATELGGLGLTLASTQGKPSKLKAKGSLAGAGLIAGSLIPLIGSEVVKYKAVRGAQNHIDSLRNNKELQAIEREYQRAQAEQEKTAGESMPARYKKIDWDNDPTGEKKKIKRKLLASGALTAAGLGVNLHQLALATRDMVKNTNHAKLGVNLAGTAGGGAGLLLAEKQLQKAEKLEGLPVGGTPNQKKSRLDDLNLIIY